MAKNILIYGGKRVPAKFSVLVPIADQIMRAYTKNGLPEEGWRYIEEHLFRSRGWTYETYQIKEKRKREKDPKTGV